VIRKQSVDGKAARDFRVRIIVRPSLRFWEKVSKNWGWCNKPFLRSLREQANKQSDQSDSERLEATGLQLDLCEKIGARSRMR
jgi:hypothetical protein